MKTINKEVLKDTASRLMFDMKEEEYDTLLNEFDVIIKQMELIGQIKGVDEAEAMTFPFDVSNRYLREDVAITPLDKSEALKNAKDVVDNQIRLPKVVG
ncbi:MAG: aspartyl/glutamyl-tRNA amidotransferase subunit C [Bacilli bacterium]|nr:aspartyl/glutamyl-tRNA amidotransferase subunit C [Bacilli bacterium]